MLTQNHVAVVKGFIGQTTAFDKNYINNILSMRQLEETNIVKYIHGNIGRGLLHF